MTRKDFKLIAEVVYSLNFPPEDRLYIAQQFANRLENENESFKRTIFIEAATGILYLGK